MKYGIVILFLLSIIFISGCISTQTSQDYDVYNPQTNSDDVIFNEYESKKSQLELDKSTYNNYLMEWRASKDNETKKDVLERYYEEFLVFDIRVSSFITFLNEHNATITDSYHNDNTYNSLIELWNGSSNLLMEMIDEVGKPEALRR